MASARHVDCRACTFFPGPEITCKETYVTMTPAAMVRGACEKFRSRAIDFPNAPLDLTKCPACKHEKHVGRVCGAEVDVTVTDAGVEPIRCPCHEEARKASTGKCKGFHLMAWDALEEYAAVLEYGAKKYAPNSWRDVPNAIEEYTNAMFRHWKKIMQGEVFDPEAAAAGYKIRHQAMFLWNAVAVTALTQQRDGCA